VTPASRRARSKVMAIPARLRAAARDASLRARVMAAAALLVVVTSLVTGILGTTLLRDYLIGRSDTQLRNFARVARHIAARPDLRPPANGQQQLPNQFLVELINQGGNARVVAGPLHPVAAPRLTGAELNVLGTPFTVSAAGPHGQSWRVLVQRISGGSREIVGYSLHDLDSTVSRLEIADALAGAVAVMLLAGMGLPLVRASLAPLGKIEETAAAIAAGDLSRRIDHPPAKTEVGRLASALDSMLARIEAAYLARAEGEARALRSEDRMRRFVADASHELRTPLTSVRGLAEYGLQQGEMAGTTELLRLMTLIERESGRMGRLVDDLLLLARFDADLPLQRRPVDLASIAAEAVAQARLVNPDRPITLEAPEPVVACVDGERIRQVIDNLIGNATQHTPPASPVLVSVCHECGTAQITVTDCGPGMTAEQAAHVFERFYRADEARSRARGGTGLGLAIAASLTAAHGGAISVETSPGQGASFRVCLPAEAL
jgi:two-component system, OmpR family, sensor kinase